MVTGEQETSTIDRLVTGLPGSTARPSGAALGRRDVGVTVPRLRVRPRADGRARRWRVSRQAERRPAVVDFTSR